MQAIEPTPDSDPRSQSIRAFINWLVGGWQLFLCAPLRLFGLIVLLFSIEILVQAAIPSVGVPVSKWVLGILTGVFWLVLDQLDSGGRLQLIRAAGRIGDQWMALAGLALLSLLVYFLQVGVACLILGSGAVDLLVFSNPAPGVSPSAFETGLIFSAGIPLSTLLMFATPLLLIKRLPPGRAVITGIRLVVRHAVPMSLLALLTMAVVFLAPATFLLSALLTGPWLLCVGLVAFRSIAETPDKDAVCR